MCFNAPDNISGTSQIQFNNTPVAIEIINVTGDELIPNFQGGSITVNCENVPDSPAPPTPPTIPPPITLPSPDLTLRIADVTGTCGEQLCVDVSTSGFTNVLAFQHTLIWDAIDFGTASITQFGLPDLSTANFNPNTPGILRVGWDDSSLQGITLGADHVLYQVCFEVSATTNGTKSIQFSSSPVPIEIIDLDGNPIIPILQNGTATITCGPPPVEIPPTPPTINTPLSMSVSNTTGNCGEQVCVDISTTGFTNLVAFQHSLSWDGAELGTARISQVGLPDLDTPNFNIGTAGQLGVAWDDTCLLYTSPSPRDRG